MKIRICDKNRKEIKIVEVKYTWEILKIATENEFWEYV